MRILLPLIALAFLGLGFAFGALNPSTVTINLPGLEFQLGLGLALLGSALLGASAGGLLLGVLVIWPLRRKLRRAAASQDKALATGREPVSA
jgi:uncharacterized integral membrane protein